MHHLDFDFRVVDHQAQRYDTIGDYFVDQRGLHFRMSRLGDWRYEACVLVHEITEYLLVRAAGIDVTAIDRWDIDYCGEGEPGEDPSVPYHHQHMMADAIERTLALFLGVGWNDYEETIERVSESWPSSPMPTGPRGCRE